MADPGKDAEGPRGVSDTFARPGRDAGVATVATMADRATVVADACRSCAVRPVCQPHPDAMTATASNKGGPVQRPRERRSGAGSGRSEANGSCEDMAVRRWTSGWNPGQKKGEPSRARPLFAGANPRDQLRSARPARVPVVVSVLPEDEPIEELLPEELGVDEELESLLDGVALELEEPLDEPVPEAPIELELGVLDDEDEDEGGVVEGEAPIVVLLLPDVVGALGALLDVLGDVVLLLPVVGVLLLVPVPLPLVEPAPVLLPADVPALPEVPPVWAAA